MFKIFHREKKKKKKPAIEKARRKERHPGCIRPSTKKGKQQILRTVSAYSRSIHMYKAS